jgi:hypothetical protein
VADNAFQGGYRFMLILRIVDLPAGFPMTFKADTPALFPHHKGIITGMGIMAGTAFPLRKRFMHAGHLILFTPLMAGGTELACIIFFLQEVILG